MRTHRWTVAASLAGLVCAGSAQAGIIPFNGIVTEDSDPAHIAIGEAQFHMQILDTLPGIASFILENTGPDNAIIGGIYFDGDILLGINAIINGAGVLFSPGGTPMDLPGGNKIGFVSDFHVTPDNPQPANGVSPGEMVEVRMDYAGSFADLQAAILGADLRVGIRGIGLGDLAEGSEAFVNKAQVPAPAALALLGLAGLVSRRRRR